MLDDSGIRRLPRRLVESTEIITQHDNSNWPPSQEFRALIGTGAVHSIVSGIVLQRLGLTASGSRPVGVLGGSSVRSGLVWLILSVSDGPPLEVQASAVSHIAPGIDALIGMDYLQNLRLTVWGGRFKVSPR